MPQDENWRSLRSDTDTGADTDMAVGPASPCERERFVSCRCELYSRAIYLTDKKIVLTGTCLNMATMILVSEGRS